MALSGSSAKPAPITRERPAAPPAGPGPRLKSEGAPRSRCEPEGTGFAERLGGWGGGEAALQSRLAETPGPFAGPLVSTGAPPGAR